MDVTVKFSATPEVGFIERRDYSSVLCRVQCTKYGVEPTGQSVRVEVSDGRNLDGVELGGRKERELR